MQYPQYIRYFLDNKKLINLVHLPYQHLSILKEAFDIWDMNIFDDLASNYSAKGQGYLNIYPGLFSVEKNLSISHYHAAIQTRIIEAPLHLSCDETKVISLEIKNHVSNLWVTSYHPTVKFGVSYHLLSDDTQLLAWDNLRIYFLESLGSYVAFIGTNMLKADLNIRAPSTGSRDS